MRTADVADLGLADAGRLRIEWADRQMPVLAGIRERFERERPLDGWRISACGLNHTDAGRCGCCSWQTHRRD